MSKKVQRKRNVSSAVDNVKKDNSQFVIQRDKLKIHLNIHERSDYTENQKKFVDLICNKQSKMIFGYGPAGTSKTFLAVLSGLKMLSGNDGNAGKFSEIIYVRSVVESSDNKLGYLPGNEDDKLGPYIVPLKEKLSEFLPHHQIQLLEKENRIVSIPVGFLRGLNWNAKYIICDEAQNLSRKELITLITRVGEFSKLIVIGDPEQSDIGNKSGFMGIIKKFNDDESKNNGIHTFEFTEDDIVRSELVKFIMKKLKEPVAIDDKDYAPSLNKKILNG